MYSEGWIAALAAGKLDPHIGQFDISLVCLTWWLDGWLVVDGHCIATFASTRPDDATVEIR